jgi:hypothetical protein
MLNFIESRSEYCKNEKKLQVRLVRVRSIKIIHMKNQVSAWADVGF